MSKIFPTILMLIYCLEPFANEQDLTEKMLRLDTQLFTSFNKCEDEEQLTTHKNYFDPDVEFYHDNGGVTWDRETMLENTRKNACGNFTRELVVETFNAYPIKDFGAITQGVHRFCQNDTDECEGKAEFVMVWRNSNEQWRVTRVLSYGHRANE